jgi:hypothetical protein
MRKLAVQGSDNGILLKHNGIMLKKNNKIRAVCRCEPVVIICSRNGGPCKG